MFKFCTLFCFQFQRVPENERVVYIRINVIIIILHGHAGKRLSAAAATEIRILSSLLFIEWRARVYSQTDRLF